jgi:hypothetical protein
LAHGLFTDVPLFGDGRDRQTLRGKGDDSGAAHQAHRRTLGADEPRDFALLFVGQCA